MFASRDAPSRLGLPQHTLSKHQIVRKCVGFMGQCVHVFVWHVFGASCPSSQHAAQEEFAATVPPHILAMHASSSEMVGAGFSVYEIAKRVEVDM